MSDNELIAEFMGIEHTVENGVRYWHTIDKQNKKMIYALRDESLHYDSNWNYLMPVVEKIGLISTGSDDFYYPRTFGMRDADGNYLFRFNYHHLITAKTLIEATHGAVVAFLKSRIS